MKVDLMDYAGDDIRIVNDKFDFSHIAEYVDIEDLVEVSNES
jgi:hypothetical protein